MPPRVVLDTNVCLDLFVFDDPRCELLAAALASDAVEAVTAADCRDEWLAVLGYPQLALDAAGRERAVLAFDRRVRALPTVPCDVRLPRCADRDDQKFLTLAAAAGARWLLSRDSALLELGRRTLRDAGFAILTPEQWSLQHACPARRVRL
ncbi:putative toxin-antitoxin system toxin component, PIN family [Frateuria sp. MAH-13]|uniref:Toxin-antitoxin system toxin component, PIN family n=1 Tax=Frateuria flava TaxID=2821489 RepID=A0ABS4DJM7_9GAMM|nr:putative toxin-antitoxin system toxin component, PIN family [Frateuria flava]MBP1473259.1 putative toxin-antitoxin system toxin component, PIN family [Frateuria flava]